jgi:hypothetical protein
MRYGSFVMQKVFAIMAVSWAIVGWSWRSTPPGGGLLGVPGCLVGG